MSDFVHLHCHSEYSLLDGAIRLADIPRTAKDFGMPAAAITDHGNLYGAAHFYLACKDMGIAPIIGCEVYVAHDHRDITSDKSRVRHHLILLAQNKTGYQNLLKIVSLGALDGFYYKPRIDKGILKGRTDGLIALSACIAGEIPRTILGRNSLLPGGGTIDDAIRITKEYGAMFPERFFLEVQSNSLPDQEKVNAALVQIAEATKLPLVATNDCHYLTAQDVEAHDVLLCIQTAAKVTDTNRMRFETKDLYYKSTEEMEATLGHIPGALTNTVKIAEMCTDLKLQLKAPPYHFPQYNTPVDEQGRQIEETEEERLAREAKELRRLAEEGLDARLAKYHTMDEEKRATYKERLEYELDVIIRMGFPGYFLIVQDFINWAKSNGIPVGPGRGSAAGSLVAWAIRITNLDPFPYGLLFERFLNIERISMPDIDVDFCEERRLEVLKYVTEKYGQEKVAQITTFGTMKAKAVVRDVGRTLDMPFKDVDKIAKLIPFSLDMTIKKALELTPELDTLYREEPVIRKLLDISMRLEGLCRHASTHAAGVVVSDLPMDSYLPLYKGKKDELVTQFDMKIVEKIGLVKFDFLGLRNMTVIFKTLDNILMQGKTPPDLDTLPLDDPETYALFSRGETDGVFQLESSGMRQYLRQLMPTCFEDIIAMLALYRPGPLGSGMVKLFIDRKHGVEKVTYPLPELEECLKDTYGVIVYQEQVMQIAQIVANYSLGGADLLRRAMGKKKVDEMAKERAKFLEGAQARGVKASIANDIFSLMEKFAEYGFNKSHSAAYALITYQTAYLKVHFPVEYMAAMLSSKMGGKQEELLKYVSACRDMGVEILPPSIQESRGEFTPHGENILYGLGGISNVGGEAIKDIVEERANGPFKSLYDFCCRVNLRKVTKRVIENLIKSGAMDSFAVPRSALFASLDIVVARAQKKSKENQSNQVSLLSLVPTMPEQDTGGIGFDCEEGHIAEWAEDQILAFEKDAIGFYLTSHPLQPFKPDMQRLGLTPLEDVYESKGVLRTGVLVTALREIITKKGDRMGIAQVEDLTGHAEVLFFPKSYALCRDLLKSETPLLELTATLDRSDEEADEREEGEEEERPLQIKLRGESARALLEACHNCEKPVYLAYPVAHSHTQSAEELKVLLQKYKGAAPVIIHFPLENAHCSMQLGPQYTVRSDPQFYRDVDEWRNVWKKDVV